MLSYRISSKEITEGIQYSHKLSYQLPDAIYHHIIMLTIGTSNIPHKARLITVNFHTEPEAVGGCLNITTRSFSSLGFELKKHGQIYSGYTKQLTTCWKVG